MYNVFFVSRLMRLISKQGQWHYSSVNAIGFHQNYKQVHSSLPLTVLTLPPNETQVLPLAASSAVLLQNCSKWWVLKGQLVLLTPQNSFFVKYFTVQYDIYTLPVQTYPCKTVLISAAIVCVYACINNNQSVSHVEYLPAAVQPSSDRQHKPPLFHLKNRSCIVVKLFRSDGMHCWEKPIENTHTHLFFTADCIVAVRMMPPNFLGALFYLCQQKNVFNDERHALFFSMEYFFCLEGAM